MSLRLRVLHLEDNQSYSELVAAKLAAEGSRPRGGVRGNAGGFRGRNGKRWFRPDHRGLFFTGLRWPDGIEAGQEKLPETPVLLVSGTIGEEAAVASLKAGATDYVLKHWPERLVPAVQRALKDAEDRRSHLRTEAALIRREKHFRVLSTLGLKLSSAISAEEAAKVIMETSDELFRLGRLHTQLALTG